MEAGEVYQRYAPRLLGYLRAQRVPEPDDVLSEVFLQVARSLPSFDGDDEHLRRWLFTIARNRVIDAQRRRARRPHVLTPTVPDLPSLDASEPSDERLLAALAQLTAEQREVIALRFVADLPLGDVATLTRRTEGAVKSMQHRALAQLARILGAPYDAEADDE